MRIKVKFSEEQNFKVSFLDKIDSMNVKFHESIVVGNVNEYYDGEYVVTPKVSEETILPTKSKSMVKNVVVYKIPYSAVSNLSGGMTATIGG